jgi:hypothetical protein
MKRISNTASGLGLTIALTAFLQATTASSAERTDRITRAQVFVTERCLLAPNKAAEAQYDDAAQESLLSAAIAGVAVAFVGDLAAAGVTALATEIDAASRETGFVAEGRSGYYFNSALKASAGHPAGSVVQRPACLVLYLPSTTGGDIRTLPNEQALVDLNARASGLGSMEIFADDPSTATNALDRLETAGVTTLPAVYIEAEIIPRREGMTVRPVLVWYRERLPGAPVRPTKIELHATFATPAASATGLEIGTVFGTARMELPEMAPGALLDWRTLGPYTSVIIPTRPRTGLVDATAQSYAAAYALVGTRQAETAAAARTAAAAERKHAMTPNAANQELKDVANQNLALAQDSEAAARSAVDELKDVNMGATNVQARFVAIRDPNKFGQTLAAALKARSTAMGTAVTNSFTLPQPGTVAETAYIQAEVALAAKQRELAVAQASTNLETVARLSDELRVLQAKLNEAAVTAHRPLPYPNLL